MSHAPVLVLLSLLTVGCYAKEPEICGRWSVDADGDGLSGEAFVSCAPPEGAVKGPASGTVDCDDGDAAVYAGASDGDAACDGVDNDCDGEIDEDQSTTLAYEDADQDGYGADGDGVSISSCASAEGTVAASGDCDDDDAAVSPDAFDRCGDEADVNCDGIDDCALSGDVTVSDRIADGGGWQLGGVSFARVTDVDGDGLDDVAVGVPNIDGVRLVSGKTGETLQTIYGEPVTDFGAALAAGDFDGDGDADLAVGAPLAADGAGELTIWSGPAFLASTPIAAVAGDTSFGFVLTPTPEIDGVDGLCSAGLYADPRHGDAYYVYCFDAPTARSSASLVPYLGPFYVSDDWPLTLSSDLEGDEPRIAIGYSAPSTSSTGVAVYALPTEDEIEVGTLFSTSNSELLLGASVWMGDVDGSGAADLLVGAPGEGEVYALLDPESSGATYTPGFSDLRWTGAPSDDFGAGITLLGDLDGDGNRELAIGGDGTLWIFYGKRDTFADSSADATATIRGFSGPVRSIGDAGDLSGDGFDDVLVCDGTTVTLLFGGPPAPESTP